MALRGNKSDNVNTKGFDNMKTSDSNAGRSGVGAQGGGGSQVSGPGVPMTSNPKGRVPVRMGTNKRRSSADLVGQPINDGRFTTSQGKK